MQILNFPFSSFLAEFLVEFHLCIAINLTSFGLEREYIFNSQLSMVFMYIISIVGFGVLNL